jgi:hypothetical protein
VIDAVMYAGTFFVGVVVSILMEAEFGPAKDAKRVLAWFDRQEKSVIIMRTTLSGRSIVSIYVDREPVPSGVGFTLAGAIADREKTAC